LTAQEQNLLDMNIWKDNFSYFPTFPLTHYCREEK